MDIRKISIGPDYKSGAMRYIIASMNVGVGDTGTIASILIEKQ